MRTLEEIRASLNDTPAKPKADDTTKVNVIGWGTITVFVPGSYVHMIADGKQIAFTRGESLDLAAALIYHAQRASTK